eukprot:GHRR01013754.1.p1 GENE.GHRR01013754.1~~GHRR01013754.1.p1  ORF type:complete len:182 (-),score=29.58 GHRR01013754.1:1096-1641(-)
MFRGTADDSSDKLPGQLLPSLLSVLVLLPLPLMLPQLLLLCRPLQPFPLVMLATGKEAARFVSILLLTAVGVAAIAPAACSLLATSCLKSSIMFCNTLAHRPRTRCDTGPGGFARGAMACSNVTRAALLFCRRRLWWCSCMPACVSQILAHRPTSAPQMAHPYCGIVLRVGSCKCTVYDFI